MYTNLIVNGKSCHATDSHTNQKKGSMIFVYIHTVKVQIGLLLDHRAGKDFSFQLKISPATNVAGESL